MRGNANASMCCRWSVSRPKNLRHVVCRKRDRLLLLPPENILWFASEDGIVKAHTESEVYWVNYQLAELEASLPEELFFRARREVLVNVNQDQGNPAVLQERFPADHERCGGDGDCRQRAARCIRSGSGSPGCKRSARTFYAQRIDLTLGISSG